MITRKLKNFFFLVLAIAAPLMAQNVAVSIGDVSVDGYTSDIEVPVVLTNPNDEVGGIQFDVEIVPGMVSVSGVDAVGAATGFSGDFNLLSGDTYRIVLYNAAGGTTISTNADTVMILHFDGSSIVSAQIDLLISGMIISDGSGNTISATGDNGSITIGHVVALSITNGTGDINETVSVTVDMDNGGVVGGVQFDLIDAPDYLTVSDVTTTDRTTGFTISTTIVGAGIRVLLYDDAGGNIDTGTGAIINIDYVINSNAYGGDVATYFENVIVSDDIGGVYWISTLDSGAVTVFPGYMEEPHNLVATSGLDGMVPLAWDAPVGPIPPIVPFTIEILTDDYPGETSWDLVHIDPDTIVSSIVTGDLSETGSLYTWDIELAAGAYIFTIYDSFGDGICCGYGDGYYRLILNGSEIATGGEFSASESVTFNTNDGRYHRIQFNYLVNLPDGKENDNYITREDFTLSYPIFIEDGEFESPYQNVENIDSQNIERDVPVSGYNIYRTIDGTVVDLIASVGADELIYTDENVVNGTAYSYYVTADYSPDGTESGASNIAEATPVEWIEISISDGEALSGTTDTLEIFINNESEVSFFYFEIEDIPDLIIVQEILPTDRTGNWMLDVSEVGGQMVVTGLGLGNNIEPGSGAVCKVVVMAVSQDPFLCDLNFTVASVKDANDNEMIWTAEGATFDVTVETQFLVMPNAHANPGEMVTIPLIINNTQDVYGVQVFLTSTPAYISGIAIGTTTYHDFSNWTVEGNNVSDQYRILLFNTSLNNPLPQGTGHIADVSLFVDANAPIGTVVQLFMEEVVVVDQNNIPMHTELFESNVYIGTPDAIYSIGDVNESSRTITIDLENTAPVYVTELDLADVPDGIQITNVAPTGRFNGSVDGQSGETEDGIGYILAYDLANGIAVGSGPILEISYDIRMDTGLFGDVITWLSSVSSADANLNAIPSSGGGFAILDANLNVETDILTPIKFSLHPAFPNPFNPTTNIRYDLPHASYVVLRVFDLAGREIRTLARGFDLSGSKSVVWDGRDNHGRNVSAGVYIYRLEASGLVESQKMVLLK